MENSTTKPNGHAQAIIQNHTLLAAGAGLIPIPVADVLSVTAIQLDMLRQLCKVYGQDYSDSKGKAFVGAISGTTISRIAAARVGSAFKMLPLIGPALGGATVALFSGAATYALGQAVAQHFSTGGSILDFNTSDLKDFYEEQLERGKAYVREWKEEAEEAADAVEERVEALFENTVEDQLAKLEKLKADGFVTETEYKRIKQRILKSLN